MKTVHDNLNKQGKIERYATGSELRPTAHVTTFSLQPTPALLSSRVLRQIHIRMLAHPACLDALHAALPGIEVDRLINVSRRSLRAIKDSREMALRKREVLAVLLRGVVRLGQDAVVPVFKVSYFLPVGGGRPGCGFGVQIEIGESFDPGSTRRSQGPTRTGRGVALAVLASRPKVHCSLALGARARREPNLFREAARFRDHLAGGRGKIVNKREHAEGESGKEEFRPGVCDGAQLAVVELPTEVGRRCEKVRHQLAALHREREFVSVQRGVKILSKQDAVAYVVDRIVTGEGGV